MKIAMGVEYNGHGLHGWQFQNHLPTVQGYIEDALTKIANEEIKTFCAGRTDAGVHATGQVIHFETHSQRNVRAWILGTNSFLPANISIRFAQLVDDVFHARFSALSRCYRYIIQNHVARPALLINRVTWKYEALDIESMQNAADFLIGEHDFSSFRSAECESKTPMRFVKKIIITRINDFVIIDIEANAFLHHMVRNIVGVLIRIGTGLKKPEWMQEVLLARDRRQAAETAPAAGLYLRKVSYPTEFGIPEDNKNLLNFNIQII